MVISKRTSEFCLHVNKGKNQEGFIICQDCGIVLDEYSNFETGNPFFNRHIDKGRIYDGKIQTCPLPLGITMIGTKKERNKKIYFRDNSYKLTNEDTLKYHIFVETNRLISLLKLPESIKEETNQNVLLYYSQISKCHKFRNPKYLVPCAIFLVCRKKKFFLKKKTLIEFSKLDNKTFRQCLLLILRNNTKLQKTFINESFRKKTILTNLSGFINQKKTPEKFLFISQKILDLYWEYLKNHSDKIITGVIFSLTVDVYRTELRYKNIFRENHQFTERKVSSFLGVGQSSISIVKKMLIGLIIKTQLKNEVNPC